MIPDQEVLQEQRPLLSSESRNPDATGDRPRDPSSQPGTRQEKAKAVPYCLLIMVLISTSYAFTEAPLYSLYESVICKDYYRKHDLSVSSNNGKIPEGNCKLRPIQQELSMVVTKQVQANLSACECEPGAWRSFENPVLTS